MNKAKFLTRFWAWLVDGIILWIFGSAIGAVIAFLRAAAVQGESGFLNFMSAWTAIFFGLLLFLLQFLYFGLMWSSNGQTLGMRFLKIKVTMQDGQGLSFLRAALRGTVGYTISSLFFFLGFIWAAFDKESQAWHDKLFDTDVFEAK